MNPTPTERDVLKRLASQPWTSPPKFDRELIARLVQLGLVASITSFGRNRIQHHCRRRRILVLNLPLLPRC